jgi:cell division protein FtsI/penicillin-binding protein 2
MSDEQNQAGVGRRQFIRSIFGLGTVSEPEVSAAPSPKINDKGKFFWTDLRTGQIGFPCGPTVPQGSPGSIMKIVSAAALTDAHLLPPDKKFECRGSIKIKNQKFTCLAPHGSIDLVQALGMSCNVYFAQATQAMSPTIFLEYAKRFGLDKSVGGFPSGKFPEHGLKESVENYALGLAADLQPSALQVMRIAALVAREGKLPYLHSAESPDSNAKPFEMHLSERSWSVLQQGMQIAARQGTGKNLDPENKMRIAIKTGTTPHGSNFQSWICGYFPWDKPNYAFVLRAFSGTSQEGAVPQARGFLFATDWP